MKLVILIAFLVALISHSNLTNVKNSESSDAMLNKGKRHKSHAHAHSHTKSHSHSKSHSHAKSKVKSEPAKSSSATPAAGKKGAKTGAGKSVSEHKKLSKVTNQAIMNAFMRVHNLRVMRRVKKVKEVPIPKPIPFSNAATNKNTGVNSLGETGISANDNINLTEFPFVLTRCDQVVHFPVHYINDEDDFRVRHLGYVTISAYLTNLFNGKDGQKLVQSLEHTQMKSDPCYLKGARGCIKVTKDVNLRLHNMDYCVADDMLAENILYVYKEFKRCRLGDSLQPIPIWLLGKITQLCKKKKRNLIY